MPDGSQQYSPDNPFARKGYSPDNPFAVVPVPTFAPPEPQSPDATAQRPTTDVRREQTDRAIAENFRRARVAPPPPTPAQEELSRRVGASPVLGAAIQAGSTIFGGPLQVATQAAGKVTGSETLQRAAERIRQSRRRAEELGSENDPATQAAQGLTRFALEYGTLAGAAPKLFGAGERIAGPLAERMALGGARTGAQFGAYETGRALLSPTPSMEQATEAGRSGFQTGLAFGAGGEAVGAALGAGARVVQRRRALAELEQTKANLDQTLDELRPPPPLTPEEIPAMMRAPEGARPAPEPAVPEGYQPLPLNFKSRRVAVPEGPPLTPEEIPTFMRAPEATAPSTPRGSASLPVVTSLAGNVAGGAVGGMTAPDDASTAERVARITAGAVVGGLGGAALGSGASLAAKALRSRVGRAVEDATVKRVSAVEEANVARALEPRSEGPATGGPSRMPQFNVARFAEDVQARIQAEAERVAATHNLPQTARTTTAQLETLAAPLGLDPAKLRGTRHWSAQHVIAASNVLSDDMAQLVALEKALGSGELTAEEAARATTTLGLVQKSIDANVGTMMERGSEAGRTLWAHRVLAQTTLDPQVWFTRAARVSGLPILPSEAKSKIARFIVDGDRQGLAQYVADLRPTSRIVKAWNLWKLGLLSAPTTQLVNVTGNLIFGKMIRASDAAAAMGDWLAANALPVRTPGGWQMGTGMRTVTLGGWGQTKAGLKGGFRVLRGFEERRPGLKGASELIVSRARALWRGGANQGAFPKFEIRQGIDYGPVLNVWRDTILNPLGIMDQMFKVPAYYRAVQDRTVAAALARGLSRAEAQAAGKATVDWLYSGAQRGLKPDDDIILGAILDAEEAVFQNEGMTAAIVQGIKAVAEKKGGELARLPLELAVPFSRTPANIGARMVEFSGGGVPRGLFQMTKLLRAASAGNLDGDAQRTMARSFGRAGVGGTMMMLGYIGAREGWIRGAPTGPRGQQSAQRLVNAPTYAIRAGRGSKTWHDLRRFAPFGSLLAFGASMYEVGHDAQLVAQGKAPGTMLGIAGRQFLEQSSLTGMTNVLGMLENPLMGGERFINSLAGSVVPSVVARTAQGLDQKLREVTGPLSAIEARLPLLSKTLAPRINQLGQEVTRHPRGLLVSLLGYTNPRTENTDDPVIALVARSGASFGDLGRRTVRDRAAPGGKRPETDAEYRERNIAVGGQIYRALESFARRSDLDAIPRERLKKAVELRVTRIRARPFRYQRAQYSPDNPFAGAGGGVGP